MNISKSHKLFSERLSNPRVLTNPEEFLGPNYRAVINFWMILDGLSKEQWKTFQVRYSDFYESQESEWFKAANVVREAFEETIGWEFVNNAAIAASLVYNDAVYYATHELIGMHKFLELETPLTFFQIILDFYDQHL